MNKLYFPGNVMEIYSEDIQYLQDAVEDECKNIIDSVMDNSGNPVIVEGFDPIIDPDDSTKIKVTQSGGQGKLLTSSGIMLTTSLDYSGIALSNSTPGITNIITAVITTTYGTYDRDTLVVNEGVQTAIDYYDYTNVYNRAIITGSIICYTSTEYAALTNKGWVVILGTVYVDTITGTLVIDTSSRIYAKIRITNQSIETNDLALDFLLSQEMVDYTPLTGTDGTDSVDDQFYGAPVNLVTDLNDIRTQIRNIKVSENWDDFLIGAQANDPEMNNLHRSGIFVDKLTGFDYTITSSGTAIEIGGGKLLINNQLFYDEAPGTLYLTASESTTVGDYTETKPGTTSEFPYPFFPPDIGSDRTVSLAHKPIDYDSVHVFSRNIADVPPYREYTKDIDYTINETNGTITALTGRDIDNESVDVYYTWGDYRTDLITISSTGIHYVEGTPTSTHKPLPPSITSSGVVPLYYISRLPMTNTITSSGIAKCNFETIPVKELRELNYDDIAQYQGDGGAYNELITSDLGTMGFFAVATNLSVAKTVGWDEVVLDAGTGITMQNTVYMETYMYTRATDNIWLMCKPVSTATTITFSYETSCGSTIYTNVTRTIPYFSGAVLPDTVVPLLLLESGVSEGITKMKISITSGASSISFWKILVGGSDLFYIYNSLKNSICSFDTLVNRGLPSSTDYNLSGGPSSLHSNIAGTNDTAFGSQSLYLNNTNDNSGFGSRALYNTNAINNSGFGSRALYTNSSGIGNSCLGAFSLYNTNSNYNSGLGTYSLYTNSAGLRNTAGGYRSLYSAVSDDNTGFGYSALENITTGAYRNTSLGSNSGTTLTTGHNVTCIGYDAEPGNAAVSNEISIGDANVTCLRTNGNLLPGLKQGLTIFYNGVNSIGINVGACSDSTNTVVMKLTSIIYQSSVATGWNHIFIRRNIVTGVIDSMAGTTGPTQTWAGYHSRYLGSAYYSGGFYNFIQSGNIFWYTSAILSHSIFINNGAYNGTYNLDFPVHVPSGVRCLTNIQIYGSLHSFGTTYMLFSSPDSSDLASAANNTNTEQANPFEIKRVTTMSNISSQIHYSHTGFNWVTFLDYLVWYCYTLGYTNTEL